MRDPRWWIERGGGQGTNTRLRAKYIRIRPYEYRAHPTTFRLGFFLKLMVDKLQREDGYYM
ncbi:MAG: hypothetical protein ACYS7Y_30030 [Planctomycetota bacterium]|jgi:hypothetical protein